MTSEYLLGPYPDGKNLGRKNDVFNFNQSHCRIHIEQAFSVLVQCWGILWIKLEYAMKYWALFILSCMKLQNIWVSVFSFSLQAIIWDSKH